MSIGGSLILAALSAVNPALGLLGSVVRFVVDDRSSPWSLVSAVAGTGIDLGVDCDLGDFDAHPEVCNSLVSLIPSVGLEVGLSSLNNPYRKSEHCIYCDHTSIEAIFGPMGEPICRRCLLDRTRRLHVPQSNLLVPSNPHTLHVVDSPLLIESAISLVPRSVEVRMPKSRQHPAVISNRFPSDGIYRNRVRTPRIRTFHP